MEVKPKLSRYLILTVLFLFVVLAVGIYVLLSSEKLTKFAINTIAEKYIPADKLNVKIGKIEGCLLEGIKIDRIDVKHVKPNFEAKISNFTFKPSYDNILDKGSIQLEGCIESIESSGTTKLKPEIASIPAFLGYECLAAMPGNLTIKRFSINKMTCFPCGNKDLEIISNTFELKATDKKDVLGVSSNFTLNWKNKLLAKANYIGNLEQNKTKLNGNLTLDIAKQLIVSEVSLAKGKKGLEVSGYVASDTLIDFQPLSQWLGYFWQFEYPYAVSGKVYCQGSWLYNSEVGFLGNLKGKYEKFDISVMGLFISLLELNGDWKLFDGNLTLSDKGSKLLGFPASLNGKVESITTPNRKSNLTFTANTIPLDKVTSSLPWMIKYSNGIPDLEGIATITVNILGNRPMVNAKAELLNLSQISNNNPVVKINGKALFALPEVGSGTINANFVANTSNGLPNFFRKFNRNFYAIENKNAGNTSFNYLINGTLEENLLLKGSVKINNKDLEASGRFVEDRFNLEIKSDENKIYNLPAVDFIDLLLMR